MFHKIEKLKKILAMLVIMCIVMSGCSKAKEEETNDIDSVTLKSNQEIVACKITAIYGNDIEYTVVKEQSASEAGNDKMPSSSGAPGMNGGDKSSGEGAPDMNKGEMPSGEGAPDMNDGEIPSGKGAPDMNDGEIPSGEGAPDMSNKESSSGNSSSQRSMNKKNFNKTIYTLTEKTGKTTIPVGTEVITSLGKTTTFSRLSNGDIIKMILEKDTSGENVVVGVWIVS